MKFVIALTDEIDDLSKATAELVATIHMTSVDGQSKKSRSGHRHGQIVRIRSGSQRRRSLYLRRNVPDGLKQSDKMKNRFHNASFALCAL